MCQRIVLIAIALCPFAACTSDASPGVTATTQTAAPDLEAPSLDLGAPAERADLSVPDLATVAPDLAAPRPDLAAADLGGTVSPIVQENARPGSYGWSISNPPMNGEIAGYPSLVSVARGGQIRFYVSTTEPSYSIQIFRLGWYAGKGGRAMTTAVVRTGVAQPACPTDASTGMIECNWSDPWVLDVPAPADPSEWASGLYVAHLISSATTHDFNLPFVVRDDARPSDFLAQSPITTVEAYNNWGGKSLYDFNSTGGRAYKVSFNRPGPASAPDSYSVSLVRFLEREGYDVTYTTGIDMHTHGRDVLVHRAFLSMGHDEYWSQPMRTAVEQARDSGVHLAFFGADASYWQVRLEPSPVTGDENRTLVCYKDATLDPVAATDPSHTTVRFRQAPVSWPEDEMIGVMYDYDPVSADVHVTNTTHWIFANTGLHDGDILTGLLGYEVDKVVDDSKHPGLVRLAHSAYTDSAGVLRDSDMTLYQAPSGALVFGSGTVWWSLGLDDYLGVGKVNPAAQQMTRNLLSRLRSP